MKDSKQNYEKSWQKKFEGAEIIPDKKVWSAVNSSLVDKQIGFFKRKVVFYKMVAAASVLIALGISWYSYWQISSYGYENLVESNNPLVEDNTVNESDVSGPEQSMILEERPLSKSDANDANDVFVKMGNTNNDTEISNEGHEGIFLSQVKSLKESSAITQEYIMPDKGIEIVKLNTLRKLPLTRGLRGVGYPGYKTVYEPVIDTEVVEVDEDPGRLWAGVNFSSGVFDPNISYGDRPSNMLADNAFSTSGVATQADIALNNAIESSGSKRVQTPEQTSYDPEFSYAYGLNMGYGFSKRFVLIGGMSYMYNNTSTSVHSYIEETVSKAKYPNQAIVIERASTSIETVNQSATDIILNNSYEFISVPISVGYYMIDKKFKWMLSAGFTTDFLLKNTISDTGNNFETVEFKPNGNSPYNPAYLNGTFGSQINYTLGKHYRFSLEPSYRYGLSYLTRQEATFNSRPSSFTVSAGIAYLIR